MSSAFGCVSLLHESYVRPPSLIDLEMVVLWSWGYPALRIWRRRWRCEWPEPLRRLSPSPPGTNPCHQRRSATTVPSLNKETKQQGVNHQRTAIERNRYRIKKKKKKPSNLYLQSLDFDVWLLQTCWLKSPETMREHNDIWHVISLYCLLSGQFSFL